jgi:hypothetical protein
LTASSIKPVAGDFGHDPVPRYDPLGDWNRPKDESPDEWVERQVWARRRPEPPESRFNTALWIFGIVWAVFVVVYAVAWAILEAL